MSHPIPHSGQVDGHQAIGRRANSLLQLDPGRAPRALIRGPNYYEGPNPFQGIGELLNPSPCLRLPLHRSARTGRTSGASYGPTRTTAMGDVSTQADEKA